MNTTSRQKLKKSDECFEIITDILEMSDFIISTGNSINMTAMEIVKESLDSIDFSEEDENNNSNHYKETEVWVH